MNDLVLDELKRLQHERSDSSPFDSHVEFQRWADHVAPLLKFDKSIERAFRTCITSANVSHGIGSHLDATGSINRAIGLVNQAIKALDLAQIARQTELENSEHMSTKIAKVGPPEKLTLKWLYEHAPWSFYVWLVGLLSLSFGLGVAFTESPLYTSGKGAVPTPVEAKIVPTALKTPSQEK
jgi:hypothetical protein